MLNSMAIGRYYKAESKIHDMNPFAKLICIILFVALSMISNDIKLNLTISIIVILVMGLSHVPLRLYYKTIFGMRLLIIFIIIINFLIGANYIEITLLVLRLITLVLYTSILTLTTPPSEIAYGLEQLLSPLKIIKLPVSKLALSISLALRFIPTIIDQSNRILKAQASRGIDFQNSDIKGKLVAVKSLLLPMFVLSFKRAEDLGEAMEVRLYNIDKPRTNYRVNRWRFFDTYIVVMHLAMLTVVIARMIIK